MKLYTEEQVRRLIEGYYDVNWTIQDAFDELTPIELPSDDLVWAQAKSVYSDPTIWAPGEELIRSTAYEHGAHWVIEQIKQQANGN